MTTIATLAMAIWLYLLLAHGRFWHSGPELAPAKPMSAPPVTVVVPARDEAAVIGATLPSLQRQDYAGALQIILINDASTDGTGTIARRLAETNPQRLDVLDGKPRPPGWSGKLWAVTQGIAEAGSAEFILLTDADITHDPRHVATLVARAEQHDLDLVSEMVTLACDTPAERAWCRRSSTFSSFCTRSRG